VPSSPNLFLVSHADGTIIVYDKDREDGVFTPQPPTSSLGPPPRQSSNDPIPPSPEPSPPAGEWNPLDSIFVTIPPWHPVNATAAPAGGGKGDRDKATKNPVSHWKVSKRSVVGMYPIDGLGWEWALISIDFVFSPDVKYVAAISEDGCLRVIDALAEQYALPCVFSPSVEYRITRLVDCYAAYFGSLACVAWSPDGRFIIVSPFQTSGSFPRLIIYLVRRVARTILLTFFHHGSSALSRAARDTRLFYQPLPLMTCDVTGGHTALAAWGKIINLSL
jgi:catabolite repression protein CreC